jgi:hypothetical protein
VESLRDEGAGMAQRRREASESDIAADEVRAVMLLDWMKIHPPNFNWISI